MTDKGRKKSAIVIIWISAIIIMIHFVILDYQDFHIGDLLVPLSNVLLIIAMYLVIKEVNKKAKD